MLKFKVPERITLFNTALDWDYLLLQANRCALTFDISLNEVSWHKRSDGTFDWWCVVKATPSLIEIEREKWEKSFLSQREHAAVRIRNMAVETNRLICEYFI